MGIFPLRVFSHLRPLPFIRLSHVFSFFHQKLGTTRRRMISLKLKRRSTSWRPKTTNSAPLFISSSKTWRDCKKRKRYLFTEVISLTRDLIFYYRQEIAAERDTLKKQVPELQQQLETELLARTDLENRNMTLKEELAFKQQVFENLSFDCWG